MSLLPKMGRMLMGFWLVVATVSCEDGGGGGANWVDVGGLGVPARAQGTTYTVSEGGAYRFVTTGGAYAFLASPVEWMTEVWVYRNRPIQWYEGEANPPAINPDASIGGSASYPSQEEAAAHGVGDSATLTVEAGEYLIFTVPDNRGWFGDNPGDISLAIQRAE
jgi:hypothetical protein